MSVTSDALAAARENLAVIIETQTAAWVEQGCPPTMTIDGVSYAWNEWLPSKMEALDMISKQLARMRPFAINSRVRG